MAVSNSSRGKQVCIAGVLQRNYFLPAISRDMYIYTVLEKYFFGKVFIYAVDNEQAKTVFNSFGTKFTTSTLSGEFQGELVAHQKDMLIMSPSRLGKPLPFLYTNQVAFHSKGCFEYKNPDTILW